MTRCAYCLKKFTEKDWTVERFNSEKDARAAIALAGRVGEFVAVYIPTPGHYTIALR